VVSTTPTKGRRHASTGQTTAVPHTDCSQRAPASPPTVFFKAASSRTDRLSDPPLSPTSTGPFRRQMKRDAGQIRQSLPFRATPPDLQLATLTPATPTRVRTPSAHMNIEVAAGRHTLLSPTKHPKHEVMTLQKMRTRLEFVNTKVASYYTTASLPLTFATPQRTLYISTLSFMQSHHTTSPCQTMLFFGNTTLEFLHSGWSVIGHKLSAQMSIRNLELATSILRRACGTTSVANKQITGSLSVLLKCSHLPQ
jgi:hypothetical protein